MIIPLWRLDLPRWVALLLPRPFHSLLWYPQGRGKSKSWRQGVWTGWCAVWASREFDLLRRAGVSENTQSLATLLPLPDLEASVRRWFYIRALHHCPLCPASTMQTLLLHHSICARAPSAWKPSSPSLSSGTLSVLWAASLSPLSMSKLLWEGGTDFTAALLIRVLDNCARPQEEVYC